MARPCCPLALVPPSPPRHAPSAPNTPTHGNSGDQPADSGSGRLDALPPAAADAIAQALNNQSSLPAAMAGLPRELVLRLVEQGSAAPPDAQRCSLDSQRCSLDAQRCSLDARRHSFQLVRPEMLPPRLRDLLVDPCEVEFLKNAAGRVAELGRGAR